MSERLTPEDKKTIKRLIRWARFITRVHQRVKPGVFLIMGMMIISAITGSEDTQFFAVAGMLHVILLAAMYSVSFYFCLWAGIIITKDSSLDTKKELERYQEEVEAEK